MYPWPTGTGLSDGSGADDAVPAVMPSISAALAPTAPITVSPRLGAFAERIRENKFSSY